MPIIAGEKREVSWDGYNNTLLTTVETSVRVNLSVWVGGW